ncbi:MAG TPA: hypothetical protein VGP33_00490, partial [Chloroflexota bacterium]|nr:hypothetical protein [Chloroflexota bacterium]
MAVTACEPDVRRAPGASPASFPDPPHSSSTVSPRYGRPSSVGALPISSSPAMALLDGRYQLLRQLGGPARMPLMVASDLQTGNVVCIRLQRFSTAMATLTAVPALAPAPPAGDGPLLPRDFGVDEGTAYLVREFVTATNLQQLLDEAPPPFPLEVVTLLRRAGDALLAADEQGFSHPGLALRHVLVTADGAVRISGYDQLQRRRLACGAGEGVMLAQLVLKALPSAGGAQLIARARLPGAETPARLAPAARPAPPAASP